MKKHRKYRHDKMERKIEKIKFLAMLKPFIDADLKRCLDSIMITPEDVMSYKDFMALKKFHVNEYAKENRIVVHSTPSGYNDFWMKFLDTKEFIIEEPNV